MQSLHRIPVASRKRSRSQILGSTVFILVAIVLETAPVRAGQPATAWVQRYHGGSSEDRGRCAVADAAGNVYVTGESAGAGSALDVATLKYDSAGALQWARRYNGPGNGDDSGAGVAVDADGNVYVTGYSVGAGAADQDLVTIKYDAGGVEQWVRRYNGPVSDWDEGLAIALDDQGEVYVTGRSNHSGIWFDFDYVTIKYDAQGQQVWLDRYNGPGNDWDQSNAIHVDSARNVYITGTAAQDVGTAYHDYATIKYDASGKRQWVAFFDGAGNNWDEGTGVGTDALGNVYVSGFQSGSGTVYDYVTVKYDSFGQEQWVRTYNRPGPGLSADVLYDMAVSEEGDVYVTGASGLDYATVKYDSDGNEVWTARHGTGSADDIAYSLALDAFGGVYVTGVSARNYRTIKYDAATGSEEWAVTYNGPGTGEDIAAWVSVDAGGNVYVTGGSSGSGTGSDYATAKYTQPVASVGSPVALGPIQLRPASPNPSSGRVTIAFDLLDLESVVQLRIHDAAGRLVDTPLDRSLAPGSYQLDWDGSRHPSGTYFYSLTAGARTEGGRLVILH